VHYGKYSSRIFVKQIKDIKYKNAYFLERSENDLYNIYSGYEPLLENYEIIFLDRFS